MTASALPRSTIDSIMIRLTAAFIDQEDLRAVTEVLEGGYLVQGARVAAFEAQLASYVGCTHAVAMNSCTSALHLSLLALGTGPGDVVIVAAYSFTATANVIELCGARPVFVDTDPDTFNMDPRGLSAALDALRASGSIDRVKAILPVHAFGQMADITAIQRLAAPQNIPVIEDAACALGATFGGRPAGTIGTMGCFSFHPRKTVTTGEGGAVVTNDAKLARTLRALRNHGLDPDAPRTDFICPGFNNRMTEFQAALGQVQLGRLDQATAARRAAAARYDALLRDGAVQTPVIGANADSVYQSYVVLLPEDAAAGRDGIIKRMKELGVEASIGTWNIPLTTFYSTKYGYRDSDFPVTSSTFGRSIALPMYQAISAADQETVVAALRQALQEYGAAPRTTTSGSDLAVS